MAKEEDDDALKLRDPAAYYHKMLNDERATKKLPLTKPVLNLKKGLLNFSNNRQKSN